MGGREREPPLHTWGAKFTRTNEQRFAKPTYLAAFWYQAIAGQGDGTERGTTRRDATRQNAQHISK